MTAPLNPEEVEAAQRTRPLTDQEKRDLLSTRQNEPGTFRQEAPEPNGARIVTLLTRLGKFLTDNEVNLTPSAIDRIGSADKPWVVLSQFITDAATFGLVEKTVRQLHEEEWRLGFMVDSGRLSLNTQFIPADDPRRDPDREPIIPGGVVQEIPEGAGDDAQRYARERNRLVNEEGLTPFQAHSLLAEWGFLNPYIPSGDQDADLESFAAGLAVMRANGEYTGEIKPEDLLVRGTVESALQLLEDTGYEGSLVTFEQFEEVIINETGVGGDPAEAQAAAEQAFFGRPPELDLGGVDDARRPIGSGLSADFTLRVPPRPPGKLRAGSRGIGLDTGDADLVEAGGGLRGVDLAGEGSLGSEQGIEYWENDNTNIFVGLTYEATVLYQTMLVDAGWLDPDDFKAEQGSQDGAFATWAAMARAMEASNRTSALTWIEAAQRSAVTREKNDADANGGEPIPVWTPGVYLAPDPDFLSQVVKTTFRSLLGREPSASEVAALAGSLGGEFRGVFDVEEAQALAEFEQNIAATDASFGPIDPETGERSVVPLEEGETFRTVEPGIESLTGIDPVASFQEQFEARFAEELARGRGRVASRDARRDIMGSIFAIDAAVGGGR